MIYSINRKNTKSALITLLVIGLALTTCPIAGAEEACV